MLRKDRENRLRLYIRRINIKGNLILLVHVSENYRPMIRLNGVQSADYHLREVKHSFLRIDNQLRDLPLADYIPYKSFTFPRKASKEADRQFEVVLPGGLRRESEFEGVLTILLHIDKKSGRFVLLLLHFLLLGLHIAVTSTARGIFLGTPKGVTS